ncbi:hypothetical protein K1719_010165 [Acacia pycnantha]|nr:hypothetical protein K1719_010165 [Acacia pycnantha]
MIFSSIFYWSTIILERYSSLWATRDRKDNACKGRCNIVRNATFFSISLHPLLSANGEACDSEKLVRVARHHAPSTIFLDAIDAIITQRGESLSEHAAHTVIASASA